MSVAGLLAVILVMSGAHVVVARYDLMACGVLNDPCIFLVRRPDRDRDCDDADAVAVAAPARAPTDEPIDTPSPTPTPPPVQGSDLPNATIPPWDGTERLNILLIGSDQRPRRRAPTTPTP